jgi:ribose transport system ATP-binding protein
VGVLLISSDMPEIIRVSDRILVMHDGAIRGEFPRAEVTQEKIMSKIMESVLSKGGNGNGN